MSLIKVLYISAFIFLKPLSSVDLNLPDKCDKLTGNARINDSGEKGAKVEIQAKGGDEPYKYIFYKESGHLISTKYDQSWVDGLQKGKYACTISDKNNCKKTIDFEIK